MQHCTSRLYSVIPDESNHNSCTAVTLNTASESTYSWWYLPKQSCRCITIRHYVQCNVVSSGHIMGSAHSAPFDRFFWCNEPWSWTAMWGVCLPVTVQTPPPTQHTCARMCARTHSWATSQGAALEQGTFCSLLHTLPNFHVESSFSNTTYDACTEQSNVYHIKIFSNGLLYILITRKYGMTWAWQRSFPTLVMV